MMPGDRAVLERLALELEILNRKSEIRTFERERPIVSPVKDPDPYHYMNVRAALNRRELERLRAELQERIARRKP